MAYVSLVPRPLQGQKRWPGIGPLPDFLVIQITLHTIRRYSTVCSCIWYSRTCKCQKSIRAGYVFYPWEILKEQRVHSRFHLLIQQKLLAYKLMRFMCMREQSIPGRLFRPRDSLGMRLWPRLYSVRSITMFLKLKAIYMYMIATMTRQHNTTHPCTHVHVCVSLCFLFQCCGWMLQIYFTFSVKSNTTAINIFPATVQYNQVCHI